MRINLYDLRLDENRHAYVHQISAKNCPEIEKITIAANVSTIMRRIFDLHLCTDEKMYELCIDVKGKLLGIFEVSHGIMNGTICRSREILQRALLVNAYGFILIHNHPSGEALPSGDDMTSCKRVWQAGELMQIPLMDFIIMGGGANNEYKYCSFQEAGILDKFSEEEKKNDAV